MRTIKIKYKKKTKHYKDKEKYYEKNSKHRAENKDATRTTIKRKIQKRQR